MSEKGNHYILVLVDICTRFTIVRALKDKSMYSVAKSLLSIFSLVGFPKILQSDNGTEFVNNVVKSLTEIMTVEHRLITPYNPRANGASEKWVGLVTQTLLKQLEGKIPKWCSYLDTVQFFLNCKVTKRTGSTPYSLVFSRAYNPLEDHSKSDIVATLSEEQLQKRLEYMTEVVLPSVGLKKAKISESQRRDYNKKHKVTDEAFPEGAIVLATNDAKQLKSEPNYIGPFVVKRRNRGGAYLLTDSKGMEHKRTIDQLKLVYHEVSPPEKTGIVDKIIDCKQIGGETSYLVKWKSLPEHLNSWVKETDFDSIAVIQKYWKRVNTEDSNNPHSADSLPIKRNHIGPSDQSKPQKRLKVKFRLPPTNS